MTVEKQAAEKDIFYNVRMKPSVHARLKVVARQRERTLAATVRIALREYLEREEQAA